MANSLVFSLMYRIFRFHRMFVQTDQDLLHTFRQLVMIPEVLENAFFHRSLGLHVADAMTLVALAEQIRATKKRAQQLHARMDEEAKRVATLSHQNDFEYAELVFTKLATASRYLCSETIRQPLLLYDHEMLLKITSATFPHRGMRVVTGPRDHVYFTFKRRHKMWHLADTFGNDLAQLVEDNGDAEGHHSLLMDRARYQRFTVRRAFPACRVHQFDQNFQLIPCISAVGDRTTKAIEIHSIPSCGAFASLGTIFAEPQPVGASCGLSVSQHDSNKNKSNDSSTLASYKITAKHESGFTFFLGNYTRKTRQRVQLQVHPGQDLIAMLMLAQLIDAFVIS